jgi:hypothetical protein
MDYGHQSDMPFYMEWAPVSFFLFVSKQAGHIKNIKMEMAIGTENTIAALYYRDFNIVCKFKLTKSKPSMVFC